MSDLFLIELLEAHCHVVHVLDFLILGFDHLVELPLFSLEELSTSLFLLCLPDQTLGSKLHLSS